MRESNVPPTSLCSWKGQCTHPEHTLFRSHGAYRPWQRGNNRGGGSVGSHRTAARAVSVAATKSISLGQTNGVMTGTASKVQEEARPAQPRGGGGGASMASESPNRMDEGSASSS